MPVADPRGGGRAAPLEPLCISKHFIYSAELLIKQFVYQENYLELLKIIAARCYIIRLKCTKFDFGRGSAPDPAGGAHSASRTL